MTSQKYRYDLSLISNSRMLSAADWHNIRFRVQYEHTVGF